jgi:G3E family GTPase
MTSVPVTTVGGYLGAGKTTLVNGLLSGDHGLRIGVLVNDFGAISIDEKLIVSRDDDVVTLANGCACCSVAGDLAMALDRFAGRTDRYEQIVIEASGVADPGRIAALAQSPGLSRGATVVVADAATLQARIADKFIGRLVRAQLSAADIIVLTKTDLVPPAHLAKVLSFASAQAPTARVIEVVQGRINACDLFANSTGPVGRLPACAPASQQEAATLFESHLWRSNASVDIDALQAALVGLPGNIERAKGIVITKDGLRIAVQRAGSVVSVEPLAWKPDPPGAEIVVIARCGTLDRTRLDGAFDACLLQPGTES